MSLLSYRDSKSRMEKHEQGAGRKPQGRPARYRVSPISSDELLGVAREREIVHNGERYQIKITRKGTLILTK
ncbi:MAG: hemin uptake protein HemP [Thiotrichaceae bacterium]|nr:hemin uptake protein HemP [Thiotrichaceae bacterium]